MEQFAQPTKDEKIGMLYDFFMHAEGTQLFLQDIIPKLKESEVFNCKKDDDEKTDQTRLRWHVRTKWWWFLSCQQPRKRNPSYLCRGIDACPRQYFIFAHQPYQKRYFQHFKSAPTPPPDPLPDPVVPPENGSTSENERMQTMLYFDKKIEEQFEQIRKEFLEKFDNLKGLIGEQRTEFQALGPLIMGDIQVPLGQVHTEFTAGIQALEDTFDRRMQAMEASLANVQQLYIPPDFSPIREEIARTTKALEEAFTREIGQLRISSELSQIVENFAQMQQQVQGISSSISGQFTLVLMQTSELSALLSPLTPLPGTLEQLHEHLSHLSEVEQKSFQALEHSLAEEIRQSRVPPEFSQIPKALDDSQRLVNDLSSLAAKLSQIFSVLPSEESKSIDGVIKSRIDAALDAINALANEHASWMKQQRINLEKRAAVFAARTQEDMHSFVTSVFPDNEKDQQAETDTQ